nr:MAG TPA: holin [Caudoviricetes sp.]
MTRFDFSLVAGSILTFLSYMLGGFDSSLQTIFIFIILDFITGILKAYKNKELSSLKCFYGIVRKMLYFILIIVAVHVDKLVETNNVFRTCVIYMLIANEGISILENLGKMGVPIPKKLLEKLESLNESE